jgi:hypothetical protein
VHLRLPLFLLALLAASPAFAADGLALIPLFSPRGGDAAAMDGALRLAIKSLGGGELISKDITDEHMGALDALGLGCNFTKTECAIRLGELAGVDRVIVGQMVPAGESPMVSLRLVSVSGKAELRRVDRRIRTADLALEADALATALLLPTRFMGELVLDVEPAGSEIYLDGAYVGRAPLKAAAKSAAGTRTLRVVKEGHKAFEQDVEVPFRSSRKVEVRLEAGSDGEAQTEVQRRYRVLVLDPAQNDPGTPPVRTLSSVVAVELARIEAFDVLSGADVQNLLALEGERQQMGCADTSCLAEIAGAMGAGLVVFGDAGTLGETLIVNLSLFDSENAKGLGRVSVTNTDRNELAAQLGTATQQLVGPFLAERGLEGGETASMTGGAGGDNGGQPGGVTDGGGGALAWLPWALVGTGVVIGGLGVIPVAIYSPEFAYLSEEVDAAARLDDDELATLAERRRVFNEDGPAYFMTGGVIAICVGVVVAGGAAAVWALSPGE